MIKIYDNNININVVQKMYEILIENLFITYPSFLKERDKYDNKDNFNKWYLSIKNSDNYKIMIYYDNNEIIGFFNYAIIDNELWITEVQIMPFFKKKGILKQFLKQFILTINFKKYNKVYLHINSNNFISQEVFKHIGFKEEKNTIYSININDLNKYLNS